ncbi:hypothetical protein PV08_08583 [Exophiala spinifera]|uniref:Zn(2)-C6 fungal-type domain-containing protein n=1 Tax=Exophiala spinifera TaxID=91928 RepID=A0A0D2B3Y4_9EURO|nr:uncharacterized protein PV08_08583 [Exophiala spinifera]KIW13395.1 hypothetical protein PV08_08583 [Exophiala spinifera]
MDGSLPTTTRKGTPRQRVSKACSFCRHRKIRCNNERPRCSNCKTYGTVCDFSSPGQSARNGPSRPRATQSSRANSRPISEPSGTSAPGRTPDEIDPQLNNDLPEEANPQNPDSSFQERSVSRIIFSDDGGSSYHGQTSALFEDNPYDRRKSKVAPVPRQWVQKGLMAEAALQRQMEIINYKNGVLDFDGVEPELGMHLLDLHWNRQHHSFLITYRPAFMRDMACNGPYFSKILLNAIYYGSSKFSTRLEVRRVPGDVRTAGWKFRQRVRELLGNALDGSEITTIQALLVMANSLFALGDERSAAWLYSGLAFRMIIDLGMHAEAPALSSVRKLSDEDLEIRRRVFWGAYVVDKIMSLYQGRPVSLQEADTNVPISFLDEFEEHENWIPFAYTSDSKSNYEGSPAYSVSTFTALCSLSVIMNKILNSIYAERIFDRSSNDLAQILDDLHSKLESWYASLAPHLKFDPIKQTSITPPPHTLSLMAVYNVLLILLHRPFVADGHLYNNARSIPVNSLLTCANAATQIVGLLRAYDKAYSVLRAPYLISYATYVSATIHVRIAAKRNAASDAHKSLGACLAVLGQNQETNFAARRAKAIVEGLISRLNVQLPDPPYELHLPQDDIEVPSDNASATNPVQVAAVEELRPDGFSPGLDIDAVIQSFAPGREAGNGQFNPPENSQRFSESNLNRPLMFGDNPPGYSSQGLFQGNANQNNEIWYDPFMMSANQVDDVLFGFNGAMLDEFSFTGLGQ